RPAIAALREPNLFLPQWLAVRLAGVMFVGGAIADMAVDQDHRGRTMILPERLERARDTVLIIRITDPVYVPAIGQKTRRPIVAECQIRVTLDRHAIVVVDPAQISQHLMASKRGRLAGDAFHHVAIATEGVDIEIEDREIRTVEMTRQPPSGERHADAVAAALPQRPSRGLDA